MTTPLQASNLDAAAATQPALPDQAGKLLPQVAGYVGVRTIAMGLRLGLIATIAGHPGGLTPEALAAATHLDPFYVGVWCRGACAADVLDMEDDGAYRLAPHMATLLLNHRSPAYIGAMFAVMVQPEIFDRFADRLPTGERLCWDQCSPDWIQAVSGTGGAFYNRLIPAGLGRIPGLPERLSAGARVLELACGAGVGLVKLARAYPSCTLVGLDGDIYSLEVATENLRQAGLDGSVELLHSTLEDLDRDDEFDVVLINISMHECRDIEQVTAKVRRALRPGGCFVISDFPFPDTPAGLRTAPGRIMSGIQFFEALIDDQLLPTRAYLDLLRRHGFWDVDAFDITPVHAVTYGQT